VLGLGCGREQDGIDELLVYLLQQLLALRGDSDRGVGFVPAFGADRAQRLLDVLDLALGLLEVVVELGFSSSRWALASSFLSVASTLRSAPRAIPSSGSNSFFALLISAISTAFKSWKSGRRRSPGRGRQTAHLPHAAEAS
jgi:hypothetical protein